MAKTPRVSHNIVDLRELSDAIATQRMHKYGAAYQSPTADVNLTRHQCALIYGYMLAAGSDQTLLSVIESIVVPASKDRHEGYQRRLREMVSEVVEDKLVVDRILSILEPRVFPRMIVGSPSDDDYDEEATARPKTTKKRKLWFPGDPPPKKGK